MDTQVEVAWSEEAPTEPGYYWFCGEWRGNRGADYAYDPPLLR